MLGTERRRGAPRSEGVLRSSKVQIPGAKQYWRLCPTSAFTTRDLSAVNKPERTAKVVPFNVKARVSSSPG